MENWPPAQISVSPEQMILGSLAKYAMRMDYMLMAVALYVGVVHYMQPPKEKATVSRVEASRQKLDTKAVAKSKNSPAFTAFVFLHNLFLAVYSGWTFIGSFSIIYSTLASEGLKSGFCDSNYTSWNSGLFQFAYIFYLSKFYEIIDTVIILMKGRRVSTLQTYHHSGAIICMWAGVYKATSAIFIFTVMNSFVHTIMYTYYALTSIGFTPPGKQYLTTMQITQFLLGFVLATIHFFLPGCNNYAQTIALTANILYLFPLTYLFVKFAITTYGGPAKKSKKE
ncbi:hypothetical protein BB559_004006 [Furculomyces boomerangus]|uniref:Elongation of fatty acids protein n=1 Tax=Furculomyces boomerangus TaxID=61424 RepID=A0A2T9YH74_9FUNG|nr:hypothetical protein BB559_004006 [Furculomyces boomerangus]